MKLRTTFLTVLTLLALIIGGTVQAQDDFDPCFGLSADDCAVINEASANGIGDAESLSVDFYVDFSADGLASVMAMADPAMEDDAIDAVTFGIDSAFDIAMDDSVTGLYLNGSMTITFSQDGGDVEEQNVDVMIVDDIFYMNANDGSGWMSIDLLRVMEDETLGAQLEGVMGDAEEDPTAALEDLGVDPSSLGIVFGILNLDGFLTYVREGDDFIFTIDFGALQALLEEENEDLLNEMVESASAVDPSMAMMIPLLPTLISGGEVVVTQSVDADLNIVTDIVVDADLELALGMLAGTADVTNTDLLVEFSLGNLDGVEMVDAPAEATDITDMVLGMAAGGMGMDQ